ncbi:hypothetical protein [Phenylobacterium montanum]|uniref:Uncharacterized protein n=1 Tax=Phenylobacterium montanum TaxID=2823693 RepID=A0A975FZX6_9CAUL|nr:hypothetical protein [Caulobacter sp. S6]QUD87912.1 hypothetical protein KCG34_23195 [Caulobacter sp. S6]
MPAGTAAARQWLAAAPLALLLAVAAWLAGGEAGRQWRIARVEGASAAADGLAPTTALARLAEAERDCADRCGPRALVAGGAARALIAGRTPAGPQRDELAARAGQDLRRALTQEPQSGRAWAWLAVAESEQAGDDHHSRATEALERSYSLAPFVRELALWRSRFAGANWAALDAASRQRAVDEVARLSLVDPGQAEQAELAFSDPNAGQALDQRMTRRGVMAR